MNGYFEDATTIEYCPSQNYPFYSFINSSWQNDLPVDAHWHYYIEILYCLTGKGRVIINGYGYDLTKDETIFIFPRDVHTIRTIDKSPFEYLVIKLNPEFLFDDAQEAFMFKHFRKLQSPVAPILQHMTTIELFDCKKLLQVHDLYINRPHMFQWQAKSILFDFFYAYSHYLRQQGHTFNAPKINKDNITSISNAFEYIHTNYAEPISAAGAANHCHLSYSYFSRQFKNITGISFTNYLNFVRITEAEKLLLDRKSSVTEVGYKVGFTDTSYFIKQFKRYKKMTPKKFLKMIKDTL